MLDLKKSTAIYAKKNKALASTYFVILVTLFECEELPHVSRDRFGHPLAKVVRNPLCARLYSKEFCVSTSCDFKRLVSKVNRFHGCIAADFGDFFSPEGCQSMHGFSRDRLKYLDSYS